MDVLQCLLGLLLCIDTLAPSPRLYPEEIENYTFNRFYYAKPTNVCTNKECTEIAREFLANMDTSLDPCDDFYKFACANYEKRYPIPDDKTSFSGISQITDNINELIKNALEEPITDDEPKHFVNLKKYYKACMNTDKIEKIGLSHVKSLIDKVGGWPVVEDKDSNATWETVLYKLRDNGFNVGNLLTLDIAIDMNDTKVWIPKIEPGSMGVELPFLLNVNNAIVKNYLDAMVNLAILFGASGEKAKKDLFEVVDFEVALAEALIANYEVDVYGSSYSFFTVESLKSEFSGFPWDNFIEHFLPEGIRLRATQRVMVTKPRYVRRLIKLLENTEKRIVRNTLIFEALWSMTSFLNKEVKSIGAKFAVASSGQKEESTRSEDCMSSVLQNYLTVASALYVQKYSNEKTKKIATELIDDLQKQFIEILKEGEWPEEDKNAGIEKIRKFYAHIAYPDELKDNKLLASLYGQINVNENEYFKSQINVQRHADKIKWEQFLHPVNRTSWKFFNDVAVVNAHYKMDTNIILLPAAILQGVFFHENRPKYLNYASIGTIIGHEMSHGFDTNGHQYDKDGIFRNWQSEAGAANYKKKKKCVVDQYSKYTIYDEHVDGNMTSGENMADFGGWKAAYHSYRNWEKKNGPEPRLPGLNYTNHQLFWIASSNVWCENERKLKTISNLYKDPHAPSQFRVNGALSNLEVFSEDFGCPVGSAMNPVEKCTPW